MELKVFCTLANTFVIIQSVLFQATGLTLPRSRSYLRLLSHNNCATIDDQGLPVNARSGR